METAVPLELPPASTLWDPTLVHAILDLGAMDSVAHVSECHLIICPVLPSDCFVLVVQSVQQTRTLIQGSVHPALKEQPAHLKVLQFPRARAQ